MFLSKQVTGASFQQDLRDAAAEFSRLVAFAGGGIADHLAAVGSEYRAGEKEFSVFQCGISADGNLASSAQFGEHGSLGSHREAGPRIVEGKRSFESFAFFESFDGEGALGYGGANDVGAEDFADDVSPAESAKPGGGEDYGIVVPAFHFGDPGIDVAADVLDIEVGADAAKLGDAAEGTGADRCPELDVAQLAADDGVAGVGALRHGGEGEAFGELGREILQAVHGEIDAPVEESLFDLAGKEAFAGDFMQGHLEYTIARRLDDFDAALHAACFEALPNVVRLPERKLRTPGPNHQHDPSLTSRHCMKRRPGTGIVSGMARQLIVRASAAAFFLLIGWEAYIQAQAPKPPELKLNKVKDNLYEIEGDGGNVAVYVTSEGVILVDDKYDQDFDQIMAKVKSVTPLPVKYVLSTHYHSDHSGGNAKFLQNTSAEIISTANARTNIVEHKQSNATPGMMPARVVFTVESSVFLGGKEVRAHYYGRGHTNGDAVIYFPQERVLHTGDLMAGNTPLIDYPGGGSLKDWATTLDGAMQNDFDTVIPGHGAVTNKAGLMAYRNDVEKEKNRAQEMIRAGKSSDDVAKAMIGEFHWTANGLQMQWSLPGMMTELK